MSIAGTIGNWWRQEQTNWAVIEIGPPPTPQVKDALPYGQVIVPHQAYVTIKMRSMAIAHTRVAWTNFHAALYSHGTLALRNGAVSKIQSVLSPDCMTALDSKKIQNVLHVDRTIFGPLPYVGGALTFEAGVVAVKHADLAAPFLGVLTDIARAAGVAFVSTAAPFVEPIKNGIEFLTGTDSASSLEIALARDFDPPRTGWYALVRLKANEVRPADFSVRPGNFELLRGGQSVPGVPYLIFSIDAASQRPDYAQIPELKAAYADFAKAAAAGNQNEAGEAVKVFKRLARLSPELLRTHAKDVAQSIEEEYQAAFTGDREGGTSAQASFDDDKIVLRAFDKMPISFHPPT